MNAACMADIQSLLYISVLGIRTRCMDLFCGFYFFSPLSIQFKHVKTDPFGEEKYSVFLGTEKKDGFIFYHP